MVLSIKGINKSHITPNKIFGIHFLANSFDLSHAAPLMLRATPANIIIATPKMSARKYINRYNSEMNSTKPSSDPTVHGYRFAISAGMFHV